MKNFIKEKLNENINNIENYNNWLETNRIEVNINNLSSLLKPDLTLMTSNFGEYTKQNELSKKYKPILVDLLNTKIKMNECFNNAGIVFQTFTPVDGIEVFYVMGIMVENGKEFGHAWNIINGKHYDFSSEKTSDANINNYYQVVVLNNLSDIENLSVFDTNTKCGQGFSVNGDSFDDNGMCSLYPYFLKLV